MIPKTLPFVLGLCIGCSAAPDQDKQDPAQASPSLDEARQLLRAQQYDEALLITDKLLADDPDNRAARLVAAEGNLAMFHSGRDGSQYFLADAQSSFEKALALDSKDPDSWLQLSYCQLQNAEFDAGRTSALTAVEQLTGDGAPRDKVASAMLAVADNEMQLFVETRRPEIERGEEPTPESSELATQVLMTLNLARQMGEVAATAKRSAQVFQWLNQNINALQMLEDGIRVEPTDNSLHEALQNLYFRLEQRAECVAAYKRLLREHNNSAAITWFLGRAQVALADDHRRKTAWAEATRLYRDARTSYTTYRDLRARDTAIANWWIAICELSLGRIAYEQGQTDVAQQHYESAFETAPDVAETDENGFPKIYDSFGGNYVGGLNLIGQAISEKGGPSALRESLAYFERIIERHPDRFGAFYNNAALSARDLGVQVAGRRRPDAATDDPERQVRMKEAMELWERSYRYYEKAVALEPDDARIVNDCGLMLIYHLHRDYDRARSLFDRAIVLGEAALADLPDDATEAQRNDLEEATGDAYQNIGVMLSQRNADSKEIRPFLVKAVRFYPYQRRQAAMMLRRLDSGETEQATARRQDTRKGQFERAIAPAKKAAEEKDYDTALLILDKLAKDMKDFAPYHYAVGSYSLQYAAQAAADGANVGLVDGLYNDALRQLKKAVELDGEPVQPRLELCQALARTGDFAGAEREATSLLSHVRSVADVAPEVTMKVHVLRAEAAMRTYIASKQEGAGNDAVLNTARASYRQLESAKALDATARTQWSTLEQWAGADEQAIDILVRGWQEDPANIGALVDTGARLDQNTRVITALESQEDATTRWYLGRARFNQAQAQWANGEPDVAIATLESARSAFAESMATNDEFKDSCEQWIGLCWGSQGIIEISKDDHEKAQGSLLTAIRSRPELLTNDLGGGSTIKRGILIVGDMYFQADDLEKVEAIYRAAGAAAPNDVDFANNHGLFARDYGVRLERDGDAARAKGYFEASYQAYCRAAEIDPSSIRLRNDRALLLIYHLERELPLAVTLLNDSIVEGKKRLTESPPEDPAELRDLQESVGDAYGNLGYYFMNTVKDYAKAKSNLTESLKYYPFERRAGTRQLRRIAELEKGDDKDGK